MTPTSRALAIQDHAQELAKQAAEAHTEAQQLIGAVRKISTALTDPMYADDPELRIQHATRVVLQTLRAWEVRHP